MYFFYYYPVGVDVPRDSIPAMTILLGITMTVIFLLSVPFYAHNSVSWWSYAYRPAVQSYLTPLTAVFLHGGWLHLAGNLLYLWVFAPALERSLGRVVFLLAFLGFGYVGNLAQAVLTLQVNPDAGYQAVVGASGAISGLMGMFLLRFYFARILMAYWVFMPLHGVNRAGTASLPVAAGVLMWITLQVFLALVHRGGGGTAYGAHLGGLLAGVFLACSLGMLGRGRLEHLYVKAKRERARANFQAALAQLSRYCQKVPWDESADLERVRLLRVCGQWGEAQQRYQELVVDRISRRRLVEACDLYDEARRSNSAFILPPQAQRKIAFWLEKSGRYYASVTAHLDYARVYPQAAEVGHSLARAATLTLSKVGDRYEGLQLLEEAIERHPDLHWKEVLQREMARVRRGRMYGEPARF